MFQRVWDEMLNYVKKVRNTKSLLSPTNKRINNINFCSSRNNVTFSKCCKRVQQKNNVVTFDLAIAKPNMQLQVEESPIYDKLFINIGVFYVEIVFF